MPVPSVLVTWPVKQGHVHCPDFAEKESEAETGLAVHAWFRNSGAGLGKGLR